MKGGKNVRTQELLLGAWFLSLILLAGCGRDSESEASKPPRRVDALIADLATEDPSLCMQAAEELATLPPSDLEKAVPALKQALGKQSHFRVKATIQMALDRAQPPRGKRK